MKLLIIEDDLDLNQNITAFLRTQHYLCESAADFSTALRKIEAFDYDCIIIDLTLPGGDGLELLRQLKLNKKSDGVIIISARNELDDRILGINLGADDYLSKPFHLAELNARVAAIIRRKYGQGGNAVVFEEIKVDIAGNNAFAYDTQLQLTRKEFDLLVFFITNKGRVLSKNAIARHLWGDDAELAGSYDFIYTHIKNLRKKLVAAGASDYLQSIYGMGYKFSFQ